VVVGRSGGDGASTESDTAFSFSGGFLAAATTFVVTHEAQRLFKYGRVSLVYECIKFISLLQ